MKILFAGCAALFASLPVVAAGDTTAVSQPINHATHAHEHRHDGEGGSHEVPEIIVTADPLGAVDGHFVAPVTILGREALRAESMRSVGEAVSNQPGISAADFGAAVGRPVIRGIGGARVRVLENGIGTLDLSSISADHGVSSEAIFAEQIEVLRGPATLLYGSGASGGLVNVVDGRIPRALPERSGGELYNHYDTASDGWLGAFRADTALGSHVALHLDGLRRYTNDIGIPGAAARNPEPDAARGVLENSDAETDRLSAGSSWIDTRGHVGVNISTFSNNYGVPGAHAHEDGDEDHGADEEEGGTRLDVYQIRYDLDAAYRLELGPLHELRTRWAYNDYEHDEIEADGALGTRFTNEEWEGRVEAVLEPMGAFDGAIGIQVRDKNFHADGEEAFVPPSTLDSLAFFVFEKADLGVVHVDLGLRYENQEAATQDGLERSAHDLFSISGGAILHYHPLREVGVSGGLSQRAPQIEELFANGPHLATNTFEIGDPGLGVESSRNVDLFWRGRFGRIEFDATAFYNDIANFVFLASQDRNGDGLADRVEDDFADSATIVADNDALLLVQQVQTNARFWGFEIEAGTVLFEDRRGRLSARAWTDYVDGELAGGETVPRLTPFRLGSELHYERGPFYIRLAVTYVGAADNTAPLETDTEDYTLLGIHAAWTQALPGVGEVELFARGTNLLDDEARRHTSFVKDLATLPGRAGLLGMRLSF